MADEENDERNGSNDMLLSTTEANEELISNTEGEIIEMERAEILDADIDMDVVPLEAEPAPAPTLRSTAEIETLYLMEKLLRQLGEPFQKTVLALQSDLVSAATQLAYQGRSNELCAGSWLISPEKVRQKLRIGIVYLILLARSLSWSTRPGGQLTQAASRGSLRRLRMRCARFS